MDQIQETPDPQSAVQLCVLHDLTLFSRLFKVFDGGLGLFF